MPGANGLLTGLDSCRCSLGPALTAGAARSLADGYDLARHHRLPDVGGGTGSFLVAMFSVHSQLEGTLFELPAAAGVALHLLTGTSVADRIRVVEGDFLRDQVPSGHDLLLIANVIHLFQPEVNRELLGRLRKAVEVGARALLVDFWTDPSHAQPLFAALMAAEFLVVAGGDAYSTVEVQGWLAETGWRMVGQRPLAGPAGLIMAEAVWSYGSTRTQVQVPAGVPPEGARARR